MRVRATNAAGRTRSSRLAGTPARRKVQSAARRVRAVFRLLAESWAAQVELQERYLLGLRPWEEEWLHWSHSDGDTPQLHGHLVSPGKRPRSTTRGGWCPAAHARRTGREAADRLG